MCVIVIIPPDKEIIKSDFDLMYTRNPDGIGFSWVQGDKVQIAKNLWSNQKAWNKYQTIKKLSQGSMLIHFRKMSRGTIELENVHPFVISNKCAMAHNGTIDIPLIYYNRSDTWHYLQYLKFLIGADNIDTWIKDPKHLKSVEDSVGFKNKLAFITLDGIYTTGYWESKDGIKYSNSLWEKKEDKWIGFSVPSCYRDENSKKNENRIDENKYSHIENVPKVLYVSTWVLEDNTTCKVEWGYRGAIDLNQYYYVKLLDGKWPNDMELRRLCYNRFKNAHVDENYEPYEHTCISIVSPSIKRVRATRYTYRQQQSIQQDYYSV